MDNTITKFNDFMKKAGGMDDKVMRDFISLLSLPDSQFDSIYPSIEKELIKIFDNPKTQEEILDTLNTYQITDFDSEVKVVNELIEEIKTDDSISLNKRNLLVMILDKAILAVYKLYKVPRKRVKVKIQRIDESAILPEYAHDSDAGADVFALEDITIAPHKTEIVRTGVKVAIPKGYEIQIRPRSGMSRKTSIRIANAPGTIDADYRGEVGIIMENTGGISYEIKAGDRIAQMVISPVPMIEWEEVSELDVTIRGEGGFGSTGN